MKRLTIIIIIFQLNISFGFGQSLTTRTATTGLWSAASTWTGSGSPNDDTHFIIPFGDTVTVDCNCGVYLNSIVDVYGVLLFPGGRKINLDEFGEVNVFSSGVVSGANKGDKLVIGGTVVWTGNTQDISGPITCDEANCFTNVTLPVELLEASLTQNGGKDFELNWITATEKENDVFDILYSEDYQQWHHIQSITGAGNSNEMNFYQSSFNIHTSRASVYLRLVQNDFNGNSKVIYEATVAIDQAEQVNVFPNPASDKVNIFIKNDLINSIDLLRLDGTMLKSYKVYNGTNAISLQTITSGYYILRFKELNGSTVYSTQLCVLN